MMVDIVNISGDKGWYIYDYVSKKDACLGSVFASRLEAINCCNSKGWKVMRIYSLGVH